LCCTDDSLPEKGKKRIKFRDRTKDGVGPICPKWGMVSPIRLKPVFGGKENPDACEEEATDGKKGGTGGEKTNLLRGRLAQESHRGPAGNGWAETDFDYSSVGRTRN